MEIRQTEKRQMITVTAKTSCGQLIKEMFTDYEEAASFLTICVHSESCVGVSVEIE